MLSVPRRLWGWWGEGDDPCSLAEKKDLVRHVICCCVVVFARWSRAIGGNSYAQGLGRLYFPSASPYALNVDSLYSVHHGWTQRWLARTLGNLSDAARRGSSVRKKNFDAGVDPVF